MPREKKYHYSILIVDDSKFLNQNLCDLLEESTYPCYKIFSALSLSDAYGILDDEVVDFVVLDLHLSDGEGEELMSYIASKNLYQQTKVIVLTGQVDRKRRENLFHKGAIDYLTKDNPINFIANEIKKTISQYTSHAEAHILVVDDSKVFVEHINSVLSNQNYRVHTLTKSNEVYDFLKTNEIHLLITDLEMPDMNGIELLRKIRQDNAFLELPIIGVSGTNDQDRITSLLKSGANDFLSKPFVIENLILKVDVTITLHKKQRKMAEINTFLQEEIEKKITEMRDKDKIIFESAKLAAMGEMMDAVAHQWMQPINVIGLQTSKLELMSEYGTVDHEKIVKHGQDVGKQIEHMTSTLNEFREFFRPDKPMKPFDAKRMIGSTLSLIKDTLIKNNIEVQVTENESFEITGIENEIKHILINLFNNAKDAFNEHSVQQRKVTVVIDAGEHRIDVIDNAGGIPEHIIDEIFKANVSTKEEGKGTGIGLYMSSQIAQKHHAELLVENIENGAKFSLRF